MTLFNRVLHYILFVVLLLYIASCANVLAPTGGERDSTAPKILKRNPSDSMLHFTGGTLEIFFDEYIKVDEPQKNITITPLLKQNPTVTYNKNKLSITISDSLLEKNTSYSISFGNAVSDIHEGNIYNNLHATFSTGSYFDSLHIQGKVIDAVTGLPDTSATILLYNTSVADSAVMNQKPLYVTKSNAGGFTFNFLPNKAFKLFAIKDVNNNLFYDEKNEHIAFCDTQVQATNTKQQQTLYLFSAQHEVGNSAKQLFNRMGATKTDNDKLTYTTNIDTTKKNTRTFNYFDTVVFSFNKKINTLQESKIRIYQDSVMDATAVVTLDKSNKKILVYTNWEQGATYTLVLQKGFATDSTGQQANTNTYTFKTKKESDYGTLHVTFQQLDANIQYIAQLLFQNTIIKTSVVKNNTLYFNNLNVGAYQLRLVLDANKNGAWDTGNFRAKKQPEKVIQYKDIITVKANWDNTIPWLLNEK